jgi:glycosyltransferase involved in cell wall biosynthesis
MSKSASPPDGVTVVIPAHNAADALDAVLPAWGAVLSNLKRPFEIVVVNDGSTDTTTDVLRKRATVPHLRVLAHDTRRGFGACLRTALAESAHPLLLYAGLDYPYTPSDLRPMLERIQMRDEVLGKQPDLISGSRAGQPRPPEVAWLSGAWQVFWRVFAGLPMTEAPPWYGWGAWWYRFRTGWLFGVPLADVNSAFKLYRVSFLKRVPIQSDGDFVHTELVAKATFLTSIMDEIPLTAKPDPLPPLTVESADYWKVLRKPEFAFSEAAPAPQPPASESPKPDPAPAPQPTPEQPVGKAEAAPSAPSTEQAKPETGSTSPPTAPVDADKKQPAPEPPQKSETGPAAPSSEQAKPEAAPVPAP